VREGQEAISPACQLNPHLRFDPLVRTGDVLADGGRPDEALATYRKAQEMIPYDRAVRAKIAKLARRLGR
jgi:transposase